MTTPSHIAEILAPAEVQSQTVGTSLYQVVYAVG
ncbi:hypothetical protein FHX62_004655 [Cupriavidus alkaliphilus]|nr:hypothetical protein [Cupriavidus alkaliphilus]